MEFKGSRTQANLMAAFAGESQARNKYTYYASKAKKDGYEQIAAIFTETADNEKEHAKIWFKELHDGAVPSTIDNLRDAAAGENYEWTEMLRSLRWSARLKKSTRSVTTHCSKISKRASSLNAAKRSYGSAATADTSMSANPRRKYAPPAPTRSRILKSRRQIIDSSAKLCPLSNGQSFLFFVRSERSKLIIQKL